MVYNGQEIVIFTTFIPNLLAEMRLILISIVIHVWNQDHRVTYIYMYTMYMHHVTCRPGDELCVNVHTCTCTVTTYRYVHDGTYRVILSIVKAGCHTVAIAQVVKH